MGVTDFIFDLSASKAKVKGVFHWILVAMVTDYVKVIDKTYLTIIHLSNDTILLPLRVTNWFSNSIKQQGLSTVEIIGSHLQKGYPFHHFLS